MLEKYVLIKVLYLPLMLLFKDGSRVEKEKFCLKWVINNLLFQKATIL